MSFLIIVSWFYRVLTVCRDSLAVSYSSSPKPPLFFFFSAIPFVRKRRGSAVGIETSYRLDN
jgi:hypothetical protein